VSRTFGERAALYVEPTWVHHANVQPSTSVAGASTDTVMLGLGGRFRIRPTVSIVTEFSPRLSGFRPGANHGGVAIDKRGRTHVPTQRVGFVRDHRGPDSSGRTGGQRLAPRVQHLKEILLM
jgi:hypothetical protein